MERQLRLHCDHVEPPRHAAKPEIVVGYQLPNDYLHVLGAANGFVSKRGSFRLFGIDPTLPALDLKEWNRSPWIAEYGPLAAGLILIGEDVFGDQYGFQFTGIDDPEPNFVKFWCEGGEIEAMDTESLSKWLEESVLCDEPTAFDWPLAATAFANGLYPSLSEHLSFTLPLIVGGANEASNLEVADRMFHLHLLGQMSLRNANLPGGTRIEHFTSAESTE